MTSSTARSLPGGEWRATVGLEVHAQLSTVTKLFSPEALRSDAAPNTSIGTVSAGLPGALPVLNKRAVELAAVASLALGCDVQLESRFARKHYFYPDLPKGYQISQFDRPLATGGSLKYEEAGTWSRCRIRRVHLEEDAAKLTHLDADTLVDLNRAGAPLIEIVTEPDVSSPSGAASVLRELRLLLRYLGVCDGNMERGTLRCDANVSVARSSDTTLGIRTEIKNLNSITYLRVALGYEIERQMQRLKTGNSVRRETLLFDERQHVTLPMRPKEEEHDYRYMPDPDLPPLRLDPEWLTRIRDRVGELPRDIWARYVATGIRGEHAELLVQEPNTVEWFERAAQVAGYSDRLAATVINHILPRCRDQLNGLAGLPCSPEDIGRLVRQMDDGAVSTWHGRQVLTILLTEGGVADRLVSEAVGESPAGGEDDLAALIAEVLDRYPDQVQLYLAGKRGLLGFFVGRVRQGSASRADPADLSRAIEQALESRRQPRE